MKEATGSYQDRRTASGTPIRFVALWLSEFDLMFVMSIRILFGLGIFQLCRPVEGSLMIQLKEFLHVACVVLLAFCHAFWLG